MNIRTEGEEKLEPIFNVFDNAVREFRAWNITEANLTLSESNEVANVAKSILFPSGSKEQETADQVNRKRKTLKERIAHYGEEKIVDMKHSWWFRILSFFHVFSFDDEEKRIRHVRDKINAEIEKQEVILRRQ